MYPLSTLKSRFKEIAEAAGIQDPEVYLSSQIKKQLMEQCPGISFISQPGMTDLVCSNDITVGDAMLKINALQKVIQELTEGPQEIDGSVEMNEDMLVHRAIDVLRRRMKKPKDKMANYYSSEEITVGKMKDFIDPLLYKALRWLTNEHLFIDATDIAVEDNLQCLNIACDLTTLATSVVSPKHLGLAVHLHHEHGS